MGYFLPFYHPNSPKNQNFKEKKNNNNKNTKQKNNKQTNKQKRHLEISFYTCVPKTMIRWCTVPEIWCTTDRWTEKVTYRGGCPTLKNSVFWTECNSLWDEKKKNCKASSLIQTLIYRSNIYYSQTEDWKKSSSILHLEVWTRYFRQRYSISSLELQWI